jgi:hypothetical protein
MPLVTPFKSQARLQAENVIACEVNVPCYADAGGLMSYGTSTTDADREVAPSQAASSKASSRGDLPIVQSAKIGVSSLGRALGAPEKIARHPEAVYHFL